MTFSRSPAAMQMRYVEIAAGSTIGSSKCQTTWARAQQRALSERARRKSTPKASQSSRVGEVVPIRARVRGEKQLTPFDVTDGEGDVVNGVEAGLSIAREHRHQDLCVARGAQARPSRSSSALSAGRL
jgi:hypothetical protein